MSTPKTEPMAAKELGDHTKIDAKDPSDVISPNTLPTVISPAVLPPPKPVSLVPSLHADEQDVLEDATTKQTKFRVFTILVSLYLTLFIAALDQTIIATAIPTITSSLDSASGYTWIGGAYLIANAAAGPIWTKLSDIWGRKPLLLGSVAFFFGASVVCAEAKSMGMLIVGRALQGTAAGGILGLVIVIISDLFSMRRRALWLGVLEVMCLFLVPLNIPKNLEVLMSPAGAIAGGAGPVLGGVFAQKLGWRWIFWINLPVCGTTFVLLLLFLDVHNPKTKLWTGVKAIDWAGSLSILAVTLMLLMGLDLGGNSFPWSSSKIICLLVFGVLAIGVFFVSEKKLARYPLMPLLLFRNRSNVAALVVTFVHGLVFIAGEYYLPLYIQSTHGASPIRSGILILPLNLTEAMSGLVCGVVTHQWHAQKELIVAGSALMLLGSGLYIEMDAATSLTHLIVFQIISGLGIGSLFNAPVIVIQNETPQEHIATATSTQAFIRTMATAIGVVIGGIIFEHGMSEQGANLKRSGLSQDLLDKLSGQNAAANVGIVSTIDDTSRRAVIEDAFARSIRNMFIFYACVAAIGVIAAFFIRRSRLSSEHTETRTGLLADETKSNAIELSSQPLQNLARRSSLD